MSDRAGTASNRAVATSTAGATVHELVHSYREPERSRLDRAIEAVDRRLPYLFLAPTLALVGVLVALPLAWAVRLSLYEVALVSLGDQRFVGLEHYGTLLSDPLFWTVARNTAVFVGASVAGQVGLGLALALLLERRWLDDRFRRIVRLSYLVPWATTGVVVAYSWKFVYDPRYGLLNGALRWLGASNPPAWLDSVAWAMAAVVVANVWRGVPFSVLFQTSGLQSVPGRCYEAAAVGGASSLQTLRHVTLPLLAPFVAMNVVLVTLFTVNVFDLLFVTTDGGPLRSTEVLSLHMYRTAFETGDFGRASALAVVLFGINLAVVACYLVVSRRQYGGGP